VACGVAGLCRHCNSECHGEADRLVVLLARKQIANEQPTLDGEVTQ
jgi:hypothetical protein